MSTRPNLLKGCAVVACALSSAWMAHAQVSEIAVEPVAMHTGTVGSTDLTGFTTYRIYAQLTSSNDYVTAVFGSDDMPLELTTTTSFWQHPAGSAIATDLNAFLFGLFTEVAYDSWFTIGLDGAPDALGEADVDNIGIGLALANFEAGNNVLVNSSAGGSWFVLPGLLNGQPDADNRVLLGQVTTDGLIAGTFNMQVFVGGDQTNAQQATLSFSAGSGGCTDSTACNYEPTATTNDGSCTYPDFGLNCQGGCAADSDGDGVCDAFEVAGCQDDAACNFDAAATDAGTCDYPVAGYDCAGNCLADTDGDGVCDDFEVVGCQDASACNFNAAATDAGTCEFPEAGYDCAGDCLTDTDGDGVCDAFEVPGCTNELASNFDPAATDNDGSCTVDPSAYCGEGTVWDEVAGQCVADCAGAGDGGMGGFGSATFGDFDGDGAVGSSDLIAFLSAFENTYE